MLFLTPPCDKVPANECAIPRNRFSITTIACIARVRVGLHTKIIVLEVEKTTSKSMIEVGKNTKNCLPMDLLGRMHKLPKETHRISDVRTCNSQVNKLPHKSAIGVNIGK